MRRFVKNGYSLNLAAQLVSYFFSTWEPLAAVSKRIQILFQRRHHRTYQNNVVVGFRGEVLVAKDTKRGQDGKQKRVQPNTSKSPSTDVDLFGNDEESDSDDDNLRGVSNVVYRQEYGFL